MTINHENKPLITFIGNKSSLGHERDKFRRLNYNLDLHFKDKNERIILIGFWEFPKSNAHKNAVEEIDAVVFKRDAIIAIEIKDVGDDKTSKLVRANKDRPWLRKTISAGKSKKYPIGTGIKNPYQQIKKNIPFLRHWLEENMPNIKGHTKIQSAVLFTRKMDNIRPVYEETFITHEDRQDFKIFDLDSVASGLDDCVHPEIKIKDDQLTELIKKLQTTAELEIFVDKNQKQLHNEAAQKIIDSEVVSKVTKISAYYLKKEGLRASEEPRYRAAVDDAISKKKQLILGPVRCLTEVNENIIYREDLCTQLRFQDGKKEYIIVKSHDSKKQITQIAQNMIGKHVKTSTLRDDDAQKNVERLYFSNLWETNEKADINKLISFNQPRELTVENVIKRPGGDYRSYWKADMFVIETEIGKFIAATRHQEQRINKSQFKKAYSQKRYVNWSEEIGKTMKVWTSEDTKIKGLYWIFEYPN